MLYQEALGFREYLNIDSRDTHDKVNPFKRGRAGAKPIDFTGRKIGTDTYFLCNRLCKDIKGNKRTGYLPPPA